METVQKIALFIDAENVSAKYGKLIMENLERRGEVFIRRIYGNWEKIGLHKWNECILNYGMRTVHQIDFSSGKNATDMSLAIDAMDVLYKREATTFAIVSNDSDFTPLAVRLREYGVAVIGIGRKDSSVSFQNACSEFISLDVLNDADVSKKVEPPQVTVEADLLIEESCADIKPQEKIAELERKVAELEHKFESPQWAIGLRLTAQENKNSAMQKSSTKIKQNIILKSSPNLDENISAAEDSIIADISTPLEIEQTTPLKMLPEPVELSDITVEVTPAVIDAPTLTVTETFSTAKNSTVIETSSEISDVTIFQPLQSDDKVKTSTETATAAKTVELKNSTAAQNFKPKFAKRSVEREKALNDRFVKCGQNGMKNPKKKLQQIHDVLHETAKIYGDKNGFVPLSFAGQDIRKKNFGFGIKDFGYTLLNEFISDFPELYELTHSKPRSFRYRCI
ncbi:MAG: NYN domain-containing protein [Selenomonadaceae bacterium]|nr:NYN domain-containing protein [Selenomonadaceae bacterium]